MTSQTFWIIILLCLLVVYVYGDRLLTWVINVLRCIMGKLQPCRQITGGVDSKTNLPIRTVQIIDFNDADKELVKKILITSDWNKLYDIQIVDKAEKDTIKIYLVPREKMSSKLGTIPKFTVEKYPDGSTMHFSYTVQGIHSTPICYIDKTNWENGVKQSKLSVDEYKIYVINHEFGHALGMDHKDCENGKCPVMYQMTRGPPDTCSPSFNVSNDDLENKKFIHGKYEFSDN